MAQLNRREFLYGGVAVSAAAALAPHTLAASAEDLPQAGPPVVQEAQAAPRTPPQHGGDWNLINWREQGLRLGGGAVHYGQFPM